jgi:hypothetical protein
MRNLQEAQSIEDDELLVAQLYYLAYQVIEDETFGEPVFCIAINGRFDCHTVEEPVYSSPLEKEAIEKLKVFIYEWQTEYKSKQEAWDTFIDELDDNIDDEDEPL